MVTEVLFISGLFIYYLKFSVKEKSCPRVRQVLSIVFYNILFSYLRFMFTYSIEVKKEQLFLYELIFRIAYEGAGMLFFRMKDIFFSTG